MPEANRFCNGQALYSNISEAVTHIVQTLLPDYSVNALHTEVPPDASFAFGNI
jgi:hypothetical protein